MLSMNRGGFLWEIPSDEKEKPNLENSEIWEMRIEIPEQFHSRAQNLSKLENVHMWGFSLIVDPGLNPAWSPSSAAGLVAWTFSVLPISP